MSTIADLLGKIGARNSKGGQDTVLAHINPKEATILKLLGGSGRTDPVTGALHFDDGGDGGDGGGTGGGSGDTGNDGDGNSDSGSHGSQGGGSAESGPQSYGPDGQAANYGTYSGWDFGTYGWGDPTVGHQGTIDESNAAYAQRDAVAANEAALNAALNYSKVDPVTGRTGEEQAMYDASMGIGQAQGVNASQASLDAANSEMRGLGWTGQLSEHNGTKGLSISTPWGFTDAFGNQQTNWGSVGRDTASVLGQFAGIAGALTGYGAIGAGVGALANLALGNYSPGLSTVGGVIGGAPGALAGGLLGSFASGRDNSALTGLIGAGLNFGGLNLGGALSNAAGHGLGGQLAGMAGNMAQGLGISSALGGLGVTNSGQGIGGWNGTTGGNVADGGSNGESSYGVSGAAPGYTAGGTVGTSGAQQNSLSGLVGMLGQPTQQTAQGAYQGYTPMTLDDTITETGYQLVDQPYQANTLADLIGGQNLTASSYGA